MKSRIWLYLLLSGGLLLPGRLAAAVELPPVSEVIARALQRAELESENDRLFKEQYYFVRSRQTEIRTPKGEVKKFKSKITTNAPSGLPQSDADDEETPPPPRRSVAQSPKQAAQQAAGAKVEAPKKLDDDQLKFGSELVKRYDFTLVGRESTNGFPLLVVDFAPKPGKLPEKDLRDRVVNRMAGRLWVDERDYAVKKCTLRLTESLSVVGGIVGEAQKFNYMFDRERTEDGLWYVRESRWHLEGRQVLVQREADYFEQRTQVRKLGGGDVR